MMPRLDELETDKFMEMSFVEFLEAINRITDISCPYFEDEYEMKFEEKINREFRHKIPIFIKHLQNTILADNPKPRSVFFKYYLKPGDYKPEIL